MKKRALITGSFDPPTVGHEDILRRVSPLFDEVYIVMFVNEAKKSFFSAEKRLSWLRKIAAKYPNVKADADTGFVADYVKRNEISVIVRGVRNEEDLRYEIPMAEYNLEHGGAETMLLCANRSLENVSSSRIRRALTEKTEDPAPLLPAEIREEICQKK